MVGKAAQGALDLLQFLAKAMEEQGIGFRARSISIRTAPSGRSFVVLARRGDAQFAYKLAAVDTYDARYSLMRIETCGSNLSMICFG